MSKILKYFFALNVFLFFFVFFAEPLKAAETYASPKAPTIISVHAEKSGGTIKPIIKGLTEANTEVDVYINNIYQGSAIVNHEGGVTDNFYFQPKINLNEGVHLVTAVAWDKEFKNHSEHSREFFYQIEPLAAPTLIKPKEDDIVAKVKPLILGLSESATFVHFFIDGVYNGKSEILYDESGTADFAYKPFLNLEKGNHIVWTVAEDLSGRKSGISNVLRFNVEDPAVSPTLFSPVVNSGSGKEQPFIVGLIKNNHKLQIFIDGKLNGTIEPEAHPSGTTDFAYKPFLRLEPGKHFIYAVAIDERGKESRWSNIIHYEVKHPQISEEAVEDAAVKSITYPEEEQKNDLEEKKTEAEKEDESVNEFVDVQEKISTSSLRNEEEEIDVSDFISDQDKGTGTSGVVDENNNKQNRTQSNIIIFSLFLFAIIVWIFWVNKELIKEKKEAKKEEKNKNLNDKKNK